MVWPTLTLTRLSSLETSLRSLRNQFTLNQDVFKPRMVDVVNTEVEHFLNTTHNYTLNPALPSEVISYIGNLIKNKSPGLDRISTNLLLHLPLNYTFFLSF